MEKRNCSLDLCASNSPACCRTVGMVMVCSRAICWWIVAMNIAYIKNLAER